MDDRHVEIDGTRFLVSFDATDMTTVESTPAEFLMAKAPFMLETLVDVAPASVRNIVDLGIFKGGSVAFYHKLFSPTRLVALDFGVDRVAALDTYIEQHSLGDLIHLYYGVRQDDRDALTAILRENFTGRSLDLVVDDCSHFYEATRASLNVLLPELRPGGLYVIEDWGWAHWPGEQWQGPQGLFNPTERALSNLIFELAMLHASRPGVISEVRLTSNMALVTRGHEDIEATGFDVSASYLARGRRFEHSV